MSSISFDAEGVPELLRERDHWVCWQVACRSCHTVYALGDAPEECTTDGCDGEPSKVPVNPQTGYNAKSNDSDTWTSFDEALAFHRDDSERTEGLGYMFSREGLVVGLDLDNVRDPESGDVEPWAAEVLDTVESWTEVSASGTGFHIYALGVKPGDNCRRGQESRLERFDKSKLEMYDGSSSRYFAVTGEHFDGTPEGIVRRNDSIQTVYNEYLTDTADEEQNTLEEAASGSSASVKLDNDDLIEKAKNAKNGDKFESLWNGRTTGYPSPSEADQALCNLLAFWTGGDEQQMDSLFRQSGLMRDKWDEDRGEEQTYGEMTIETALDGRDEFYDPGKAAENQSPSIPDEPLDPEQAGDTADVQPDGGAADTENTQAEDDTESIPEPSESSTLTDLKPVNVAAVAGLGEDDSISDLNDREKAASVWTLIRENPNVHIRVRRDTGTIWGYDDGIWRPEGERALRHAARKALGSMNYGSNTLAELKAQARADPAVEVEKDTLGLEPGKLAVENGLLYLDLAADDGEDDELRDLEPDDYALTRLPVEYDPEAEYGEWDDYVTEWVEDGRADAVQEYVGYCLHVGEMPIHRALLLVGSGANGKGTFLHAVRGLLGEENTSSIELQTLANERDAVADFYGSLANIDDDLSARKLGQGLGMFKKLVAGDRVRARRLYEDGFEFDAVGKHLYAANEVPDVNVPEDDEAFWRRWILVEFPNHYPPDARDPDLREKLTEPDQLSGILNWAIAGRARLLQQGYFTNEERYAQAKRERWQAWGDSIDQFIEECLERDEDAENISTGQVHQRYAAWCRENGLDIVGQQKLTNTLKNENFDYGKKRVDGTSTRAFGALGFSDEVPDLDETPEREPDPSHNDSLDSFSE